MKKLLTGKLILLIEADPFMLSYIGNIIKDDGAQILGPAGTVDEASTLIANSPQVPHAAVVSASIFEQSDAVFSDAFERLSIPLLLTFECGRELSPSSANHDVLTAPFAAYQVIGHLRRVLA